MKHNFGSKSKQTSNSDCSPVYLSCQVLLSNYNLLVISFMLVNSGNQHSAHQKIVLCGESQKDDHFHVAATIKFWHRNQDLCTVTNSSRYHTQCSQVCMYFYFVSLVTTLIRSSPLEIKTHVSHDRNKRKLTRMILMEIKQQIGEICLLVLQQEQQRASGGDNYFQQFNCSGKSWECRCSEKIQTTKEHFNISFSW